MVNTGKSSNRSGWKMGCGVLMVLLGFGAVIAIALLLAGVKVGDLTTLKPGRDEIVDQVEELADVVDDFYGDDDQDAAAQDEATEATSGGVKDEAAEDDSGSAVVAQDASDDDVAEPAEEPVSEPVAEEETDIEDGAEAAGTGGETDVDAAPDEPEEEPTEEPSDDPIPFEMIVIGLMFKTREYYSTGTVAAGTTNSDPYAFVKSSYPSMNIKLRTMPTEQFPGATPAEGMPVLFRERVQEKVSGSGEWVAVTEPFDLDMNGLPGTRMNTEYRRDDEKTFCYRVTAIRGETRSGFIYGSYGGPCSEKPGMADEIDGVADSVQITEPGPVCSVGFKPDSEPAEYTVGCDYLAVGWVGVEALKDAGYTDIVLGPVTFDECAAYMREHDQPGW